VSWKHSSVKPKWARGGVNPEYGQPGERPYIDGGPDLTRVLLAGQWVEAAKGSCAHARPGLSVDFDEYRGVEHQRKDFVTALKMLGVDASTAWEKPPKAAMPAAAKPVAGTKPAAKAVAQKKPVAKKAVKK
jgi:hypothetical protein